MQVGVPTWIDTTQHGDNTDAIDLPDRPNWQQPPDELQSFEVHLGASARVHTYTHALAHGMCVCQARFTDALLSGHGEYENGTTGNCSKTQCKTYGSCGDSCFDLSTLTAPKCCWTVIHVPCMVHGL